MDLVLQISSMIVSIVLIVLILMQVRGGALGSLLGGDAGGGVSHTRRGLEKTLFQLTIFLSIAFLAISAFSVALTG